jgi:hypothetical protein
MRVGTCWRDWGSNQSQASDSLIHYEFSSSVL